MTDPTTPGDNGMTKPDPWKLLSEGLDLCVRARKMDDLERKAVEWQMRNPGATRSGTIALWVQEQYETDLADWEKRVRNAMHYRPETTE